MTARSPRGRIHYAWLVAGVTFLVLLLAAGVRSIPGVLILPLEHEFGWTRAAISLAVSINLLLYGLCGPFAAAAMERFGMRRLMAIALLTIAIAVALTTQMRAVWQLQLLWGLIVGLGTGSLASWMSATVANRWFAERRGLVVGLLTASTATGQIIFLPLLATVVERMGWRWAALVIAALAALAIPLVLSIIRNGPWEVGQRPYGAPETEAIPAAPKRGGNPLITALRFLAASIGKRDFQLLAASYFVCGATTIGVIGTHLIPASVEHGIPEVTAAGFLAMMGVFALVGTTGSGWLSDRFDNRWLLCWYYGSRGLALLLLPYAYGRGYFGLALFVVFYGLDWVATVPPTVRLAADLLGREHVSMTVAWIFAAHQLGAAIAAFGAGALRTVLGDYQVSFMSAGVLCLIAAGMVIRLGRQPARPALPSRPVEAPAVAVS